MLSFKKMNVRQDDEGHTVADFSMKGLSTDEKPVEKCETVRIGNGSIFYDMDPGSAKLYAEKLAVEPERKVIDLKPYLNMNIVEKVNEYLRITITGKTGIIDIGGVSFQSSANGQTFLSGLPFKIKNRAVVNIFRDVSQGVTTNAEYCTLYTTQGGNSISVHSRTANPYYGQMVIELV